MTDSAIQYILEVSYCAIESKQVFENMIKPLLETVSLIRELVAEIKALRHDLKETNKILTGIAEENKKAHIAAAKRRSP